MKQAPIDDLKLQEIKGQLAGFVEAGQLDQKVIDLLIFGRACAPLECELLDYKELLEDSRLARAKAVVSIVSFYNTYGGYLIYGVREKEPDTEFEAVGLPQGSINVESLKALLNEYTGERINISLKYFNIGTVVEGEENYLALLFVPKRTALEPLAFGKDGPGDEKKKQLFFADDIYYRKNDECVIAKGKAVMFLAAARPCPYTLPDKRLDALVKKQARCPNNLPDRSFICARFIGRRDVIDNLWLWFADDFSHVRVLAGEGGLGKTSIAYQFSEEVCTAEESPLERIIWLTAKTKQFSGIEGRYLDVPETHFRSYSELMRTLCLQLGYLDAEIAGSSDRLLKHRIAEGARISPCLIVIDDVDSLEAEEQRKVLEIGFLFGGTGSRLLMTTRMNQSYSADIAIQIEGFVLGDYSKFVESLNDRYAHVKLRPSQVEIMHSVTSGSPMFTESLYRHMRWMTFDNVVNGWRGKLGEAARSAALEHEVGMLTPESKRVLLANAYLKDCSYSELSEITGYPDEILTVSIDQLSSLYLLGALHFTDERRFQVTTNTQQFVVRIQDALAADHVRVLQRVKDLRTQDQAHRVRRENPIVGAAIGQAIAQLTRYDVDRAIETVVAAEEHFPRHPDLLTMKARCFLRLSPPRFEDARALARAAYSDGSRKVVLFEIWYDAELGLKHYNGAVEAAQSALEMKECSEAEWLVRRAAALWHVAGDEQRAGNLDRSVRDFWACDEDLKRCIALNPNAGDRELLEQRYLAHDSIWNLLSRSRPLRVDDASELFDHVRRMIREGDSRNINYDRLCDALTRMHGILNAQRGDVAPTLRNLIDQRISEARQELNALRETQQSNERVAVVTGRIDEIVSAFDKLFQQRT